MKWGEVTTVTPFKVRVSGDAASIAVPFKQADWSPAVNDKVLLVPFGASQLVAIPIEAA